MPRVCRKQNMHGFQKGEAKILQGVALLYHTMRLNKGLYNKGLGSFGLTISCY